ncbi:hypothetical protein J6590_018507 [Homalodisca vitripennis]|nr:hypothetical protein J6590_018507 [Homalodisca vitripennis]
MHASEAATLFYAVSWNKQRPRTMGHGQVVCGRRGSPSPQPTHWKKAKVRQNGRRPAEPPLITDENQSGGVGFGNPRDEDKDLGFHTTRARNLFPVSSCLPGQSLSLNGKQTRVPRSPNVDRHFYNTPFSRGNPLIRGEGVGRRGRRLNTETLGCAYVRFVTP